MGGFSEISTGLPSDNTIVTSAINEAWKGILSKKNSHELKLKFFGHVLFKIIMLKKHYVFNNPDTQR